MTYMSQFIGSVFEDSYFNGQHTAQHSIAILPIESHEIDQFDFYCDTWNITPDNSGLENVLPDVLRGDLDWIVHHDVGYVETVARNCWNTPKEVQIVLTEGEDLIAVCERLCTHQYRNLESTGDVFERVFLFEDGSVLVVNGADFDYGRYESSPLFGGMVLGGAA